jgi:hypothetical protein
MPLWNGNILRKNIIYWLYYMLIYKISKYLAII